MFETAEVTFKVTQGHWISHVRLSISLQLQLCFYIWHRFWYIISYFAKRTDVIHDPEHIPFGGNLSRMH